MAQPPDDSALADAYLRHFESKDPDLLWAWEKVLGITESDPERAWELTLSLVAKASNPRTLS
jgi:hypothetical protein